MIAAAKLTPVDPIQTLAAGKRVLEEAQLDYGARRVDLAVQLERRFDAKTRKFVDYWVATQQQLELQALSNRIAMVRTDSMRRFLQVVLSSPSSPSQVGSPWPGTSPIPGPSGSWT